MIPNFYPNMPFEDYDRIDAVNYSSLKHLRRSPMYYRYRMDHPQEQTEAMQIGSAAHHAILEPDRIGDIAIWTGGRRYGKEWEAFKDDHAYQMILRQEDAAYVAGIAAAVHRNETARKYLRRGQSEVVVIWEAFGRLFKGRLDRWNSEGNLVLDLKTCRDCRPWTFGAQAHKLGYHIQMAMYVDGVKAVTGIAPSVRILAPENKPPFESAVYRVPEDVLDLGRSEYITLLHRLIECETSGLWPPEIEDECDLQLPAYAFQDDDNDVSALDLQEEE